MAQQSAERIAPVRLADEPPFKIGGLAVDPARRQVARDGVARTLEPRVMQVLVALAHAEGKVVGRDELVERCWDGRIVGENAINQVISRIRALAATVGDNSFEIETITKVGYRLILDEAAQRADAPAAARPAIEAGARTAAPPAATSPIDRRLLLGAVAAAGVGVAGFGAWRALDGGRDAIGDARALTASGREALRQGLPEHDLQAIAYFRRATELNPGSAGAWGALARGYAVRMDEIDGPELAAQAAWTRSAARRALALDPGNVDARAALIAIRPNFRNWVANEAQLREALRRHPGEEALEAALGWLLCDTGRWREAIACFRRALARETFHPINRLILAWGLWGGGELAEAERTLEDAARLWPGHRYIWATRFEFLATMGKPAAAIALLADERARPLAGPGGEAPPIEAYFAYARALETRTRGDIDAAAAAIVAARELGNVGTSSFVTYFCALGMVDTAFERLEAYFFGGPRGISQPPPGPLSRRKSSILFSAQAVPLRRDPRFPTLTRRVGLDDYWRATGTRPDYRG